MTVSPLVGTAAGSYVPPPPAPPHVGETSRSFGYGSLSPQQLATLRAAAGYNFNWPPTPDSGLFPLAAVFVANPNLADPLMAGKPLTVDTLKALAAAGLIDAAGVARGAAFLRGQLPATGAADGDPPPRPSAGAVTADGSRYL